MPPRIRSHLDVHDTYNSIKAKADNPDHDTMAIALEFLKLASICAQR